jgi:2-C-methyl-D-erythritol 4-phosphate cytidylyltransferase/2-C-methyl-D-erythritol 2,4-cyclodiphosphate synthase
MNSAKACAIIPAAGSGIRMGLPAPKQFLELEGQPILLRTLRVFQESKQIDAIIVVVPGPYCARVEELVQDARLTKVCRVVAGGARRQDSVLAGLEKVPEEVDIVLVHDGVRPFVPPSLIAACLQEAAKSGAAMAGVPVKDTLKRVTGGNMIDKTFSRADIWQAQTPQAARKSLLLEAFQRAAAESYTATDEAGLLELLNCPVKVVPGSEKNIKITRAEDLTLARAILMEKREQQRNDGECGTCRSGYGYDAHRLVAGRPLVLGGMEIPHEKGLLGHSDADVLTHALCDAMLGAAGAGDIGSHFPDTAAEYKNISSLRVLAEVADLIAAKGYGLANGDITVVAQQPRLAPYLNAMKKNLAAACNAAPDAINIKATTTEEMGFEGRGEGMSAHAVVLLQRKGEGQAQPSG